MSIDPMYLENEVYAGYEAAGETNLPAVSTLLDTTIVAAAQKL